MKKNKLIQLLQSCDETELIQMEHFLASPFHNQDEVLPRLFQLVRHYHPHYNAPELRKENIFRQLYPNTPYNDKLFRYLLSDLNKTLERFLAYRQLEKDPQQFDLILLESFSERGLEKAYRQMDRKLKKKGENHAPKSSDYFFHQWRSSEIREAHFQRQQVRRFDPNLQLVTDDLDKYYFLHRLKLSCAMLDRQGIFQDSYKLGISQPWLDHLTSQKCFAEPIIRIYYSIFQALSHEQEESHFDDLKTFLDQPPRALAREELRNIYLFAINYCARKIRKGQEKYVAAALDLYRRGIENNLLINEHGLSPWAFTNVVKLALRLQRYEWIEGFISRYAPRLPETFRENALHYNLAELYYYTGRFDQSQEHLMEVAYSDLNYYLGARVLLAKIYYETGEEEALLSLLSSFTVFLKRNRQVSHNLKHTYLNFCRILFQIVRRSPRRLQQLQAEIDTATLLTDREWLLRMFALINK